MSILDDANSQIADIIFFIVKRLIKSKLTNKQ